MNRSAASNLKVIAALISISIGAQLTIDVGSIPITGQTLCILIWAFFLSPKESFIALFVYLILGGLGMPIFADGSSGFSKFVGGSGGFLVGFLLAAVIVSYYKDKWNSTFCSTLVLTFIGTIIIMALGTARLVMLYGLEKGLEYGFHPFWEGAIFKIILGSMLVWGILKFLKK